MLGSIGDLHIDDFCKDTAKILIALYKRFPVKTTLYVEDISGPDQPDEFGLHSPRFEACFSSLIWLKEADYIWYSSMIRQEAVEETTLSHRGFSLLSSVDSDFSTMDNSASGVSRRVDRLTRALKNGNSEQLKQLVLRYMLDSREFK